MPRRVSDTFKAGMITDVIGAEGSVAEMIDMYVRRSGELSVRGSVACQRKSFASAGYHCGWSQAQFHPNIGTAACRGQVTASSTVHHISQADRYQLMCAPLHASVGGGSTPLDFAFITEGTNKDQVPIHAGVATAASAATGLPFERIIQMSNAGDEIIMAGEIGSLYKWGGTLIGAYNTGTVAVASASGVASRIVTGTGTSWATAVQEGQYILISGVAQKANGFQRSYRITKVVDNTHLEVELPIYASSFTGLTYRIQSVAVLQSPDGVWNQTDERPRQVGVVAYHQGRAWTAGVADKDTAYNTVYNYDRIRWSGTLDENSSGFSHLDLWGASASIDIFPGIGGSIRGLVSMGNELVVVKSHGLFRVTGSAAWDGSGSGLGVQIISTEVGANGFNAWVLTSRGLVIAARDGLYLYDGESVNSLTDGKVKRWWEANYPGNEYSLVQFEDKVIASIVNGSTTSGAGNKLVWDSEQNLFYTIATTSHEYIAGISCYTSSDAYSGDFSFRGGSTGNDVGGLNNYISYDCLTYLNHKWGYFYNSRNDSSYTSDQPLPALVTQPFALGEDPLSEGRVNNIFVHAAMQTNYPVAPAVVTVQVVTGNSFYGLTNQLSTSEECGLVYAVENNMYRTSTIRDRVWRLPFEDMDQAPSARIVLDFSAGAAPFTRIFAIGIDYEPSNVTGFEGQ